MSYIKPVLSAVSDLKANMDLTEFLQLQASYGLVSGADIFKARQALSTAKQEIILYKAMYEDLSPWIDCNLELLATWEAKQ